MCTEIDKSNAIFSSASMNGLSIFSTSVFTFTLTTNIFITVIIFFITFNARKISHKNKTWRHEKWTNHLLMYSCCCFFYIERIEVIYPGCRQCCWNQIYCKSATVFCPMNETYYYNDKNDARGFLFHKTSHRVQSHRSQCVMFIVRIHGSKSSKAW